MNQLTLYSREVCTACDQAESLLLEAGVEVTHVFIEDNLQHLERYGRRVPVLAHVGGSELTWPWDAAQLHGWLKALEEDVQSSES